MEDMCVHIASEENVSPPTEQIISHVLLQGTKW
jgi:hypothetical protein